MARRLATRGRALPLPSRRHPRRKGLTPTGREPTPPRGATWKRATRAAKIGNIDSGGSAESTRQQHGIVSTPSVSAPHARHQAHTLATPSDQPRHTLGPTEPHTRTNRATLAPLRGTQHRSTTLPLCRRDSTPRHHGANTHTLPRHRSCLPCRRHGVARRASSSAGSVTDLTGWGSITRSRRAIGTST